MTNYDPVKKRKYYLKNQKRIDAYQKEYREKNREYLRKQDSEYYHARAKFNPQRKINRKAWEKKNAESIREYQKQYRKTYKIKIQNKIFKAFGEKCTCCGKTDRQFLTIDHINGRTGNHKRKKITGTKLWAKIVREGCDKTKYQILCFACNLSKGVHGICAHKWPSKKLPTVCCETCDETDYRFLTIKDDSVVCHNCACCRKVLI